MKSNDDKHKAQEKLQQILEEALNIGADSIELEYSDGGLEVCYILGNTGFGATLADRKLIGEIIGLIIDQAKLEHKSRGVLNWMHLGKQYNITVREYEHFDESAYRLILKKPNQKAGY